VRGPAPLRLRGLSRPRPPAPAPSAPRCPAQMRSSPHDPHNKTPAEVASTGALALRPGPQRLGSSNLNDGLICLISLTIRSRLSSVSGEGCAFQAV